MNRYLVKLESITEVDAIDESDATTQVMKKLESLNYHFPSIKRIPNIELNDGVWRTKKEDPDFRRAMEEKREKCKHELNGRTKRCILCGKKLASKEPKNI